MNSILSKRANETPPNDEQNYPVNKISKTEYHDEHKDDY